MSKQPILPEVSNKGYSKKIRKGAEHPNSFDLSFMHVVNQQRVAACTALRVAIIDDTRLKRMQL
jgi:hypothetical protein